MNKDKIILKDKESFCLDDILRMVEERKKRNDKIRKEEDYGKGKDRPV